MNILVISEKFVGGGLETRIIEQIVVLRKLGIHFYLMCGEFNPNYKEYFDEVKSDVPFIPCGKWMMNEIVELVEQINKYAKSKKIDVIDCQPFWNVIPATIAAQKDGIPIMYTLHGNASGDFIDSRYKIANIILKLCLIDGVDQTIVVAGYLKDKYSDLVTTETINNSIKITKLPDTIRRSTEKVAIASRLDSPKTRLIIDFLPLLHKNKKIKQIDIYGDGDSYDKLVDFVSQNNYSKVRLCGWQDNLKYIFYNEKYGAVFGMGRVALEGLASGSPVGILGHGGFAGMVNEKNLPQFIHYNFSCSQKYTKEEQESMLREFYKETKNNTVVIDAKMLQECDVDRTTKKYLDIVKTLESKHSTAMRKLYRMMCKNNFDIYTNDMHWLDVLYRDVLKKAPTINTKITQQIIDACKNDYNEKDFKHNNSRLVKILKKIHKFLHF